MNTEQKTDHLEPEPTRRSLLNVLWLGLGLAALAEMGWVVFKFLRFPKRAAAAHASGTLFEAGAVHRFAPNTVTAFPRGHFYLARLEDGGFLALHRRCTHLGCSLPWDRDQQQFICPCHASVFDIRGEIVRSPAARAMDLFPVSIENQVVRVETEKPIRRSGFSKNQVVYPSRGVKTS